MMPVPKVIPVPNAQAFWATNRPLLETREAENNLAGSSPSHLVISPICFFLC